MLCYAVLCYAMLCCAMLCYAMLCCVMLCYAMLCYAMLCYALLCYAVLCYVMLCCAMLCYAMLCCTMLYYAMLCCAVLCCAMKGHSLHFPIMFLSSYCVPPQGRRSGCARDVHGACCVQHPRPADTTAHAGGGEIPPILPDIRR
jgi:hypothetical protein